MLKIGQKLPKIIFVLSLCMVFSLPVKPASPILERLINLFRRAKPVAAEAPVTADPAGSLALVAQSEATAGTSALASPMEVAAEAPAQAPLKPDGKDLFNPASIFFISAKGKQRVAVLADKADKLADKTTATLEQFEPLAKKVAALTKKADLLCDKVDDKFTQMNPALNHITALAPLFFLGGVAVLMLSGVALAKYLFAKEIENIRQKIIAEAAKSRA
jgi:hypothetical protein